MLLRLSRLSSCLAAAAAGLMLFGPPGYRGLLGEIAAVLALAALGLWRGAVALQQRTHTPPPSVDPALALGAAALAEAEALVERAGAEALSFDAALLQIAELLRGELGARAVRVFLVTDMAAAAGVRELIVSAPGFRAPRRDLALDSSAVGRALREQRICIDLPQAIALPVVREGRALGLIELSGIEIACEAETLDRLLASSTRALEATSERAASAASAAAARRCRTAFAAPERRSTAALSSGALA